MAPIQNRTAQRLQEKVIEGVLFSCALVSVLTTVAFVLIFFSKTFHFFSVVSFGDFFGTTRWAPLSARPGYGIWPLLGGTLLVSAIAMAVALPLGLLSAVFLSEFAPERLRRTLKPLLEILAGIPTVVYGYFALLFVTPLLRQFLFPEIQFWNALSAGMVMGIMILPMVSSISEDALHAVPEALRQGAYAMGATRFEVALRVVLPAALSGVAAACILAVSRAIGETMIVAIAAGQTPTFPPDPLRPIMTLTAYIVNVATGDHPAGAQIWDSLFAVGTLLFTITLSLNVISHALVERFRERYL